MKIRIKLFLSITELKRESLSESSDGLYLILLPFFDGISLPIVIYGNG